jgi:hypothetical protein
MYIVFVDDEISYETYQRIIVGGVYSKQEAIEYVEHKNATHAELMKKHDDHLKLVELRCSNEENQRDIDKIKRKMEDDFYSSLTEEEKSMWCGGDEYYCEPTWKYEPLEMICL